MNIFFSADYVMPIVGTAIPRGIVEITPEGIIVGIHTSDSPVVVGKNISFHAGIITPGFINAHCHLELSHTAGNIPKLTGLIGFLQGVMSQRAADTATVIEAMKVADRQMHNNGIVAVYDHANTAVSAAIKAGSHIRYHTFVETLGFEPGLAQEKFNHAQGTAQQFAEGTATVTAHAPYSVSRELFQLIDATTKETEVLLSIHNQESEDENNFFKYKRGGFLNFYEKLGKDSAHFNAQTRSSLQTFINYLSPKTPVLLVHNTYTTKEDILFMERQDRNVTWCFCPNANRYIEGVLPAVSHFIQHATNIVLGTDSLASNDRLCILSELKTIHRHSPDIPFTETIAWATINGARALGIDNHYGSLEKGKQPGLNLLKYTDGLAITEKTEVIRLV